MAKFTTRHTSRLTLCVGHRMIHFEPSVINGIQRNAEFVTNDKKTIALLESHPMFGSGFFREEEPIVKEVEKKVEEPKDEKRYCADGKNIIEELSVTSLATAKNYIQRTFSAGIKARNVADAKKECAERFNVVFPNWNN